MKRVLVAALLVPFCVGVVPASADSEPGEIASPQLAWVEHPTGVTGVRLRGLAAVSRDTAWVSGNNGTVLRTADGGATWRNVSPTGVVDSATLQFRDIEAFDADTAVILGFGVGEEARVYRTTDAGAHWTETFRNTDADAFYDCMAFFDHRHGLAVARPVGGKFRVLSTSDGGRSWSVLPNEGMPPALADEFTFAAGGRCISVFGGREAWIATAGPLGARVLHSRDRGLTWTASVTPLAGSDTAGAFATAFRTPHQGIAIGGDVLNEPGAAHVMALTRDGGATWTEPVTGPHGYRSAVTWWLNLFPVAVGPNGSDVSLDGGRTWRQFSTSSFDAIDCTELGACWASGARARVATLSVN
jgi:photosystem II stability/assembly factor-like uncharacterized protein